MGFKVANVEEYFSRLGERFVADKAKGVNTVVQYDLTGDGNGFWSFPITDGALGEATKADEANGAAKITITMKGQDFIDMANGDLDGRKAYMTRKMKVKGNIMLAQKMKNFLPPSA